MDSDIKIACIGAGYVGGPTMAVLADKCPGVKVYVYDSNRELIDKWNSDAIPIFEIGLTETIQRTRGKCLFFTSHLEEAALNTNIFFVAVNTPTKSKGIGEGKACDTKYFENAIRDLTGFLSQHQLKQDIIIVEKSTIPIRTCEWIRKIFCENQKQYPENKDKLIILSNPEFLAEGSAINDLLLPDRIIIGGNNAITHNFLIRNKGENTQQSQKGVEILKKLYSNWVPEEKILTSNIFSSELGKLISNAFLAQRISSINSISAICEKPELISTKVPFVNPIFNSCIVAAVVGSDSRIGSKFLKASVGFGGSCLQKDVLHLIYLCESLGLKEVAEYWQGVIRINEFQKKRFSDLIINNMFHNLYNKNLCIFGVAFKKNTQDVRGSAAIQISYNLLREGALLNIYDPKAERNDFVLQMKFMGYWEEEFENKILWFKDPYEASHLTHAIIVLTEWDEFCDYDYEKIYEAMRKPAFLFDGRNMLDPQKNKEIGFESFSIGKACLN